MTTGPFAPPFHSTGKLAGATCLSMLCISISHAASTLPFVLPRSSGKVAADESSEHP